MIVDIFACKIYNLCMTDYTTIRSRRKTVSIMIKNGKVIVRAPLKNSAFRISDAQIDEFVKNKQTWIEKQISKYNDMLRQNSKEINYTDFYLFGSRLNVVSANVKRIKIETETNTLYIPVAEGLGDLAVINSIVKAYKKIAKEFLLQKAEYFAKFLKCNYTSLKLTNARRKWGSCSAKNGIHLNWRLVILPPRLSRYVVIHELCHTMEFNHSKRFWALVAQSCPDYKLLKKELKSYSYVTDLFR